MPIQTLEIQIIILFILIFLYNSAIFSFLDTLLENRRIKKWMLNGVYLFNVFLFFCLVFNDNKNTTQTYFIIILCLWLELFLLYRDALLRVVFVTLAVTIHIMGVRAMILGGYALYYDITLYQANHSAYALDSLNVTLLLLVIASLTVKRLIPARAVKIIQQHKEQLVFMTTWLVFANAYFLFNSLIFSFEDIGTLVKYNLIAVALTIFFALYTVLLFTIKVGNLLNYKEKSEEMENIAANEKQYKNSIIEQAIIGFEINLNQDLVIMGFGKEYENMVNKSNCYSELVANSFTQYVHPDDMAAVLEFMSIEHLLEGYQQGAVEQSLDYRMPLPDGSGDVWFRATFNLYKASTTDDIMAFSYGKDVTAEKLLELEMKNRSERDSLTGLFNHGMTKQLINEFVANQQPPYQGALMIIDIDNFKLVNDSFGHGFGDEVLRDISQKLLRIFRCGGIEYHREEHDIVGRIGGDEFMVFVKISDIDGLTMRAKKICEMLKSTFTTAEGQDITISASVGIALVSQAEETFESLYAKADIALYRSKGQGKDEYSFYNGEEFQSYQGRKNE